MKPTMASIKCELDAAFATVQSAMTGRNSGGEEAVQQARRCVLQTTRDVRNAVVEGHLSESEVRLLEAKLSALNEASRRMPA